MSTNRFFGLALMSGGLAFLIANTVITPMMPTPDDWTATFASPEFLARLSVAAASVFLLLIGAFGIQRHRGEANGWFGRGSFALLFVGSMTMFAHEWAQVFFLHPLAKASPEGLRAIGDASFPSFYLVEAFIGLSLFTLGWLLLAISMLISRRFHFAGPGLLLVGLLGVGPLAAALPGIWGFVVGNSVIGLGWILIGRDLLTPQQRDLTGSVQPASSA